MTTFKKILRLISLVRRNLKYYPKMPFQEL